MLQIYRIFYEQNKFILENFTNLSERIKEIIDYKGISINKFSILVGTSNSYFNKILRDNNSIGSDKLEKILRTFPEINPEWLLTGQGEMLRNTEAAVSSSQPQENDKYIVALEKQIALLEKNISLLEKENAYLEQRLELAELKDKEAMALKIKKQRKEIESKDEIINLQNEELDAMKSISLPSDKPLRPSKRV